MGFSYLPPRGNRISQLPRFTARTRRSATAAKRWFKQYQAAKYRASLPEVVGASPMREENEAQHEQDHKEIILSDHDVLLLLLALTDTSIPRWAAERCDDRNI
jgi:hypothetical protein